MESGNVAIAVPGDPERARAIIRRGRRIARFDVIVADEGADS